MVISASLTNAIAVPFLLFKTFAEGSALITEVCPNSNYQPVFDWDCLNILLSTTITLLNRCMLLLGLFYEKIKMLQHMEI